MISTRDWGFALYQKEVSSSIFLTVILPTLLPVILIIAFFLFMNRQQNKSANMAMNFGKSRATLADPSKNKITFADVAGAKEEKEDLAEIVDFLKSPKKYLDLGARIPKGVLMVGPPGTGKTLLAKAVAGEAKVPFFSISGSDFVEMFVGMGASRVRDLFDQAKRHAPSIVFIDEIDAVGRHRGAGLGGGHDEREQTLNQLLVEMDGFSANEGVVVLAATNRRDILDPALLRPGRFDRQINVNYPDLEGRVEILKVHSRKKPLDPDVDIENIAKRTPFATGADLENIMNEAALQAARENRSSISSQNVSEAVERVQMGPEKRSHKVLEEDRIITAYHEAGHAIVGHYLKKCDEIELITIVPRGPAAGFTLALPSKELDHSGKKKLLQQVSMMLGGRAAESLTQKDVCTGAVSDLKRATEIIRAMVTEYGMSDELGPVYLGGGQEVFVGMEMGKSRDYSEVTASLIDKEVRTMLDECYR
ncbi:MAG: cell division protein FtsH, partial [Clostridiales bacterium]|nr:cell division protein FtsH [Clostridiales bacterium]